MGLRWQTNWELRSYLSLTEFCYEGKHRNVGDLKWSLKFFHISFFKIQTILKYFWLWIELINFQSECWWVLREDDSSLLSDLRHFLYQWVTHCAFFPTEYFTNQTYWLPLPCNEEKNVCLFMWFPSLPVETQAIATLGTEAFFYIDLNRFL